MKQAQFSVFAAKARVDEAQAPLWPQLTGTLNYRRQQGPTTVINTTGPNGLPATINSTPTPNTFTGGVQASQLVWDFGQTLERYHSAERSAEAQVHSQENTVQQSQLDVRSAFFAALAQQYLLEVAQANEANSRRHLVLIEGQVQVGVNPPIDLASGRSAVATAVLQRINAEAALANAKAKLNQAMGTPGNLDYALAKETFPVVQGEDAPLDTMLDEALKKRPELLQLGSQHQAQESTVASVKGAYWPTIGISTAFTETGTGDTNINWAWLWNAQATLSWQFFQGGLTNAQVHEQEANLGVIEAEIEGEQQQVRVDLEQAQEAVRADKEAQVAAREAATNAQEQLNLAEGRYKAGVGSIIELGDAQVALATAQAQVVQADYNLATARAQLVKALGR